MLKASSARNEVFPIILPRRASLSLKNRSSVSMSSIRRPSLKIRTKSGSTKFPCHCSKHIASSTDWEESMEHFNYMDKLEKQTSDLKVKLQEAVKDENYREAAKVKKEITNALAKDPLALIISEIKNALCEGHHQQASKLSTETGYGLRGWWLAKSSDYTDPSWRVIRITPETGRLVASYYSPRELLTSSPGRRVFEIFVTKEDDRYKLQAVFWDYKTSKIGDVIASNPEVEENETFETEDDGLKKNPDDKLEFNQPILVPVIDVADEELKKLVKDQVVAFSDDGIERIPAEIGKLERNIFTLCVLEKTQDPRVLEIVEFKEPSSRPTAANTFWTVDRKPDYPGTTDPRDLVTEAKQAAQLDQIRKRLPATIGFYRITTDEAGFGRFSGLFIARYGPFDVELLLLENFDTFVRATKLTGNLYVPAGKVTFEANLNMPTPTEPKIYPVDWVARYGGLGQTAQVGFQNPIWILGELLELKCEGTEAETVNAELAFVFHSRHKSYVMLLYRWNLPVEGNFHQHSVWVLNSISVSPKYSEFPVLLVQISALAFILRFLNPVFSSTPIFIIQDVEMPDIYREGEYVLGGFAMAFVQRDLYTDGKNIVAGDVLIGLPSSGVHSNGFSLIRRVLSQSGISLKDQLPGCSGKPISLGKALMTPTVIYVKQVLNIISKSGVKGIAHIAVGGFDNICQMFPKGLGATIYKDSWEVPAIIKWIQEAGKIEDVEMRRTFNMGIGMVLVVSPDASARILAEQDGGYSAYHTGEVTSKEGLTYQ